jgi:hypothetical protein
MHSLYQPIAVSGANAPDYRRHRQAHGENEMIRHSKAVTALILALTLGSAQHAIAQQDNAVTAIDVALEPGQVMEDRAHAANAALLADFPKGFPLDATHRAHVTLLQVYVRTADLEKVYAAAKGVLASSCWKWMQR